MEAVACPGAGKPHMRLALQLRHPRLGGDVNAADFAGYMNNLGLPHPKLMDIAVPANLRCGRPDGAAMDSEGAYWVAMFEGQRLLRLSPDGEVLREVRLPVRCATMPCFGGPHLRTIYITTARENRPAAELLDQPLAGCVLALDVDVPGLPVHFARI